MVKFNELLIMPYNKGISIKAEVLNLSYFDDVYIDSIYIDTQDTFSNSGVSNSPIFQKTIEGNNKSIELFINESELPVKFENSLFFVYIKTKGTPSSDTPCGMDEAYTVAAVADVYKIYRQGIQYIRETYNSCEIPKHFIDFILRFKAFQMCLKTRDFLLAIKYWNMFNGSSMLVTTKNCGCHG